MLDGEPEVGACIPLFQYALFGKYQRKRRLR
jgi:hypothetical protein